jgi:hypothetical protein
MATLLPFQPSPERAILQLLLDGLITSIAAQNYLDRYDAWLGGYSSFPEDTWVGMWNGQVYTGSTFDAVSAAIHTADPNANPYLGYVPIPSGA